ncbi:MAG: hypothetical protein BHV61_01835 [Collinsella sp. 60_9]|nr:MAG: hypothetical protein BHV61_01835 [Collinsella sp. 60_9]
MKEQNARAVALMMETLREHRRMSVKLRARFLQAAIDFARLDPEGKTVAARMYAETRAFPAARNGPRTAIRPSR